MFIRFTTLFLALFLVMGATPQPAQADDAFSEFIKNKGDWMVRLRAISNNPHESEDVRPRSIGGDFNFDHEFSADASLTYFLEDRLAVEFRTSYTEYEGKLTGSSQGNLTLGEFTAVPAMAFLQYHFDPALEIGIAPYFGAGFGYWFFFDANDGADTTFLDVDSTSAMAVEFGVDVPLTNRWAVNFNATKYWVGTELQTKNPNTNSELDFDPLILGLGFQYKFRQKTFDDYGSPKTF